MNEQEIRDRFRERLHFILTDAGIEGKQYVAVYDKIVHLTKTYAEVVGNQRELEGRIKQLDDLWEVVPIDADHVGTVKDISNLLKIKLQSQQVKEGES